jgi:hypothetical protein
MDAAGPVIRWNSRPASICQALYDTLYGQLPKAVRLGAGDAVDAFHL